MLLTEHTLMENLLKRMKHDYPQHTFYWEDEVTDTGERVSSTLLAKNGENYLGVVGTCWVWNERIVVRRYDYNLV